MRLVLLLAASVVAASATEDGYIGAEATPAEGGRGYIVTFKDDTDPTMQHDILEGVRRAGGSISHRYTTVLLGFAGVIPEEHAATLRQHPAVDDIELDHEVHAMSSF